jgi:endonuclease/exonuclease/phosphatase (EEP) superfamily protein YafD
MALNYWRPAVTSDSQSRSDPIVRSHQRTALRGPPCCSRSAPSSARSPRDSLNNHLITAIWASSRWNSNPLTGIFLTQLQSELADSYYDGPLVLTGDMNHYPGPLKADLAFRRAAGLAAVDVGGEKTWPSRRTSFVGSRLSRLVGGHLDDILYRGDGMEVVQLQVADVASDHRALIATFAIDPLASGSR